MKSNKIDFIIVTIFIFILFIPSISYFFLKPYINDDTTNTENRELAKKPEFNIKTITEYPKNYEAYYNDNLPYRNKLITIWRDINFVAFKKSYDDRVVIGKDESKENWLFYDNLNDGDPLSYITAKRSYSDNELKSTLDEMNYQTEKLKSIGISLYYFIIPNKSTVYAKYLPKNITVKESSFNLMYNYLISNNITNIYYPYDILCDKNNMFETYYRTDTHWNKYGAYLVLNSKLRQIYGQDQILIPEISGEYTYSFNGDLKKFMGIDSKIKDNDVKVKYNNSDSIVENIEENEFGKVEIYNNDKYLKDETILIVGDSYTNNSVDYLSSVYKKTIRVYLNNTEYDPSFIEKYKPDKIFLIRVERHSYEGLNLKFVE